MKKQVAIIFIVLISLCSCRKFTWDNPNDTTNPSTEPASLKNGLVAYYPFNGNANDESGNGNNGNIFGPSLFSGRLGAQNSCYQFDGINDYIELPFSSSLDGIEGTINVWIKTNGLLNNQRSIIGEPQGRPQLVISPDITPGVYNARIQWKSSNSSFPGTNSVSSVSTSKWVMITALYSLNSFRIYVNGVLENTSTTNLSQDNCSSSGIQIGGFNPQAGCQNILGFTQMFNGLIDDIRIYNRALTQQEITYLANN